MTNPPKQCLAGSNAFAVVTPVVAARLREIKDYEAFSRSTDGSKKAALRMSAMSSV